MNRALLDLLGLPCRHGEGAFHPLTAEEAACVERGVLTTPIGSLELGSTALCCGSKWYAARLATTPGGEASPPVDEATRNRALSALAAGVHPAAAALAGLGGMLAVIGIDPADREINVLLPLDRLRAWGGTPEVGVALLDVVFAAQGPPAPGPLIAVANEGGTLHCVELQTPDGGGLVAAVTSWETYGEACRATVAHASMLKAAAPLYAGTAGLLHAFAAAHWTLVGAPLPADAPAVGAAVAALAAARAPRLDQTMAPAGGTTQAR